MRGIASSLIIVASAALTVAQRHHYDPFHGSGCTCESFCNYGCSINATKAQNLTVYRMTPFGVFNLGMKDTGDVAGDTSFVISRKTSSYNCRKDPNQWFCNTVTQFHGDNKNSTDVIIEFVIEVDGQWGPYLECNPVNTSDPTGEWSCVPNISPSVPNWPKTCAGANYGGYPGHCISGWAYSKKQLPLDQCCTWAQSKKAHAFSYRTNTSMCELHLPFGKPEQCDGLIGFTKPPSNDCDCPRVHKSVGREGLDDRFPGANSMHPAGGSWYSHPGAGECTSGAPLGHNNCTWRTVQRRAAINATCMYERIDNAVVAHNTGCFKACPQPQNVTSDCYLKCYYDATVDMSHAKLTAPWNKAFATQDPDKGGCPRLSLPGRG